MSKPVIIGSFPHSGDRYFNAFLCSNFPHFIGYSANYFPFAAIIDNPEDDVLMKTQDSDPAMDFYLRSIYLVRDPLDICAEYQIETEGKEKPIHTVDRWIRHVNDWKNASYQNEVLFVKYEDTINNKEALLKNISEFFDGIEIEENDSREDELEESVLEIGKYKNILSDEDIEYITEHTESIMKELPWREDEIQLRTNG